MQLTHSLDARFGLSPKSTMSQRDVPGTTRSLIPGLLRANVRAYTGGVNVYSAPPFVPRAFVWSDLASNTSIPAMVHPYNYGGISYSDAVVIPGFSHAIVFDWRGDNAGPPQSVDEVKGNYATVQAAFPGATVFASTLDNFTQLLTPAVTATLPILTSEIGDTWMHGAASDPQKSQMYKRAAELRRSCIASGACSAADPVIANFTRFLLKNNEHTWGKSQPVYFADYSNWSK